MIKENIVNGIRCHMDESLSIDTLPQTLITLPHFDTLTAKQWLKENGYKCSNNPSKQVDNIIFKLCETPIMKAVREFQKCEHSCCDSTQALMCREFLNYFLDNQY